MCGLIEPNDCASSIWRTASSSYVTVITGFTGVEVVICAGGSVACVVLDNCLCGTLEEPVLADICAMKAFPKSALDIRPWEHTTAIGTRRSDVTFPRCRFSAKELDMNADSVPLLTTLLNHVPRWLSLVISNTVSTHRTSMEGSEYLTRRGGCCYTRGTRLIWHVWI